MVCRPYIDYMRIAACLLVALFAWAAPESGVPTTPAGHVLSAWLEAVNSGERARLQAYLDQYESGRETTADSLMSLRDRSGGFTLIRIEESEPLHILALVKEREGDNFGRLELELTSAEPPKVKALNLHVVPAPSDQPAVAPLSFDGAVKDLDTQATDLAANDKFSGDVLIARSGRIVFQKAYGLADRERHIPNTMETRFRIGSMNKMFTATAILQLAGEGNLDLDAPLAKYLPDYPNQDLARKVTIRNLLTHTGGTGDIFTPEYENHRLETRELTDYVKLFGSRGLDFEPGSKWAYSNYGFVLLGVVVQKVSGMSYYDYVRAHIFLPAGMHDTDSLPESENVSNRSVGYMRKNGSWVSNADILPWRGTSAGGGYSTVGDLFRFAEALSSGKLLKPALFEQMITKQAGAAQMPSTQGYGFGMMVAEEPQGKRFGHGGGAPGMNGELRVYPRTNTAVVVLANVDPPAASRLADFFDQRMPVQ